MKQITICGHSVTIEQPKVGYITAAFHDKADNGKYLSVRFAKCANSLYTKAWAKAGLTKTVLPSWWSVDVYANDTDEYKEGHFADEYNPSNWLTSNKKDFNWILEATEGNAQKIVEEIVKRAYGSDASRLETDEGSNMVEQPKLPKIADQFKELKSKHPDAVLLFRIGDFYESYDEDAETIHKILGVTLTKTDSPKTWHRCIAGFPVRALDEYVPKLVRNKYRVAICDELSEKKTTNKR